MQPKRPRVVELGEARRVWAPGVVLLGHLGEDDQKGVLK